jgi:aminoglycoside 3-N-acetyltransferase
VSASEVIAATTVPATVDSLARDLSNLGVRPGMTLLAHSSLSALGWVCGGDQAVILALEKILTRDGTLVMPAHSGLSDPAHWEYPPVPESWWPVIRRTMPAYEPDLTPTYGMGAIAEAFRRQTGVLRSDHPRRSFAAWGKHAHAVTRDHRFDNTFGDGSPLSRLYDLDAWVLLLGVGHDSSTSLHLAECRASFLGERRVVFGAPMLIGGQRHWVEAEEKISVSDVDDFPALGVAFFAANAGSSRARAGTVGIGRALLLRQTALVDFAVAWMEANRSLLRKE